MKFHSKPLRPHDEVPFADEGQLENLFEAWEQRAPRSTRRAEAEPGYRCFLVCSSQSQDPVVQGAQLAELIGLVEARGDTVVGSELRFVKQIDPRTFMGTGYAQRIAQDARAAKANLLVVDGELSPSQTRNLEDLTGFPICDREAVILEVFRGHASTKRARLQVELAQLEYLRPRIRGIGLNMDQQMGGSNKARGPGETASELLARRIDRRLTDLRRGLQQLKRSDSARRKHREPARRVALVGYTNAGKTSLMNALTRAGLSARDRPFETLETTSRALSRHGGDVLLSDTVGFIRRLPERLLASFESTLAEALEATLLLVVVDVSDPEAEQHLAITTKLLEKLGAQAVPRLLVFNKCDRVDDAEAIANLLAGTQTHVLVSSRDAASVERLRDLVLDHARSEDEEAQLFIPYEHAQLVPQLYATTRVMHAEANERGTTYLVRGSRHAIRHLTRQLKELPA